MEMDAGAVVGSREAVLNMHNDCVTPVSEERWAGNGPVDCHCRAGDAVWRYGHIGEFEIILADDAGVGYLCGTLSFNLTLKFEQYSPVI